MRKYRKTNQDYVNDYDRYTIKSLKKLEHNTEGQPLYKKDSSNPGINIEYGDPNQIYNPFHPFYNTAVFRAQNKQESIRKNIAEDERKDSLVRRTSIPQRITCRTCEAEMFLETHYFGEQETEILFVFACPNQHKPKRVMYPDGIQEKHFAVSKCEKCGGALSTKTEESKHRLKFVDTCVDCSHEKILEYEMEPEVPLNDSDVKKYCTDWIGKTTFEQDLEAIAPLIKQIQADAEQKLTKKEYNVDKIEKLKVPQLELRLTNIVESLGFIKFKFDNVATSGPMVVLFSAQDPTDRDENDSLKIFSKAIKEAVFRTNWRITHDGLTTRFGVLNGRLKGVQDDDGLLKIAKEIHDKIK